MPGLRLTLAQARRLWQLDALTCELAINALLEEGFLVRTSDGAFLALPGPARPLKARLVSEPTRRRA